jgi:YHS domain-containing protein
MQDKPTQVIDPVCGMTVDVAAAEAAGLTAEYEGRTYAFCRAECRRAFLGEPEAYAERAAARVASPVAVGALAAHDHGVEHGAVAAAGSLATLPLIDEGMRRWYESCSCCLSDAYPEIKAQLDAERAAAAMPPVDPGICEVAEAGDALSPGS